MAATLFCFNDGSETFFFYLEGDYRHLNSVYINSMGNDSPQKELLDIVFTAEGGIKVETLPSPITVSDCLLYVIHCGFLP